MSTDRIRRRRSRSARGRSHGDGVAVDGDEKLPDIVAVGGVDFGSGGVAHVTIASAIPKIR
jgi:hypothetical protein